MNREGYGTGYIASVGMTYTGQFENSKLHGYGHCKWESGDIYYGQLKEGKREGYGFCKSVKGDEYDGEWKDEKRTEEGVLKWGATGTIERCNFKDDKIISMN